MIAAATRWLPFALCALVYALIGVAVGLPHPMDNDQTIYHLPTILQFARRLPQLDLAHYNSASGPLPYVLLAIWARLFGPGAYGLRVAVALFGFGALFALWRLLARASVATMTITMLLIFTNQYYLFRSFTLYTVVPALCFAIVGLLFFERWRRDPGRLGAPMAVALLISCAVLSRQIYISYALGLLAYAAFSRLGWLRDEPAFRPAWSAVALQALPLALLAPLIWLWGGTTPQAFAAGYRSQVGHTTIVPGQLDFMPLHLGFWFWPLAVQHRRKILPLLPLAVVLAAAHLAWGALHRAAPAEAAAYMGTIMRILYELQLHGVPTFLLHAGEALLWMTGILVLVAIVRTLDLPYRLICVAHLGVMSVIPLVAERYYLPLLVALWVGARPQMRQRWPYIVLILQSVVITVAYFLTH